MQCYFRQMGARRVALTTTIFIAVLGLLRCARGETLDDPPSDTGIFITHRSQHDIPGAAPKSNAALDPNACASCHPLISAEWQASQHASAATDPVFRDALASERDPSFCNDCHTGFIQGAPGVGCASCHPSAHTQPQSHPQPVAIACAACHEFAFPDRAEPLMQRTASEHQRSPFSDRACADCHMPRMSAPDGRSHTSHAWASTRSAAAHQRAVSIDAERNGQHVHFSFRLNGVGHAYPTGDLFRRVTIAVEVLGPDQQVRTRIERSLARHFELDNKQRRIEVSDDRLRPEAGETLISLDAGPQSIGQHISYTVKLERVVHLAPQSDAAAISSSILLSSGILAP